MTVVKLDEKLVSVGPGTQRALPQNPRRLTVEIQNLSPTGGNNYFLYYGSKRIDPDGGIGLRLAGDIGVILDGGDASAEIWIGREAGETDNVSVGWSYEQ